MSKLKDITNRPTVQPFLMGGDSTTDNIFTGKIAQDGGTVRHSARENAGEQKRALHQISDHELRSNVQGVSSCQ